MSLTYPTNPELGPARVQPTDPEVRLRVADGLIHAIESDQFPYADYLLAQLDRRTVVPYPDRVAALESRMAVLEAENARLRELSGGAL